MRIWERASFLIKDEPKIQEWLIFGPLSLLCTLALSSQPLFQVDLFLVGAAGLFLCAKWQVRGCTYALILLLISSLARHLFIPKEHVWQLGLEFSIGFSFLITALCFEEKKNGVGVLESLIATKEAAISNLEQDLSSLNESSSSQMISLQEKIEALQKEIDEAEAEKSSLLILNDVLRKNSARSIKEKEALEGKIDDLLSQTAILKNEQGELKKEYARLKNKELLAEQNAELFIELNQARLEKEQLLLDHENLSLLKEKEAKRAALAEDQIASIYFEKEILEKRLFKAEYELKEISDHWQELSKERDGHRLRIKQMEQLAAERNFLKERLEKVTLELEHSKAPDQAYLEKLHTLESLYKQLKRQFEEKDQILHETRRELFREHTELEALKIEKEQKGEALSQPLPLELQTEISLLETELSSLKEENLHLTDLVTQLSSKEGSSLKKKA